MRQNIGQLLFKKFQLIDEHLLVALSVTDCGNISKSQSMIFASLGNDDITISGIAKNLGISRQAVQKTVSELVNRDFLVLKQSQNNKSAKIVALTQEGEKCVTHALSAFDEIECRISKTIGAKKMKVLKEILEMDWKL